MVLQAGCAILLQGLGAALPVEQAFPEAAHSAAAATLNNADLSARYCVLFPLILPLVCAALLVRFSNPCRRQLLHLPEPALDMVKTTAAFHPELQNCQRISRQQDSGLEYNLDGALQTGEGLWEKVC